MLNKTDNLKWIAKYLFILVLLFNSVGSEAGNCICTQFNTPGKQESFVLKSESSNANILVDIEDLGILLSLRNNEDILTLKPNFNNLKKTHLFYSSFYNSNKKNRFTGYGYSYILNGLTHFKYPMCVVLKKILI